MNLSIAIPLILAGMLIGVMAMAAAQYHGKRRARSLRLVPKKKPASAQMFARRTPEERRK
jgi:hypothetical protein